MKIVELIKVNARGDVLAPSELSSLIADVTNSLFIIECRKSEPHNGEYIEVHEDELRPILEKLKNLKKLLSVEAAL